MGSVSLTKFFIFSLMSQFQCMKKSAQMAVVYIDGLVQDCSNSSALAMQSLQSCTKPLRCARISVVKFPCYLQCIHGMCFHAVWHWGALSPINTIYHSNGTKDELWSAIIGNPKQTGFSYQFRPFYLPDSIIITWSICNRYYYIWYDEECRIQVMLRTHKRHPQLGLTGKLWTVFHVFWGENYNVIRTV